MEWSVMCQINVVAPELSIFFWRTPIRA